LDIVTGDEHINKKITHATPPADAFSSADGGGVAKLSIPAVVAR